MKHTLLALAFGLAASRGVAQQAPPAAPATADSAPATTEPPRPAGQPATETVPAPEAEPLPEPAPLPTPVAPPAEPTPAQPVAPPAQEAAVAPETFASAPRPEERRRVAVPGGLYIRLGAGIGFPFGPEISDDYAELDGEELRFSGQALALDIAAGGAVLPWLVVGAGVLQDVVGNGTVRNEDDEERSIDRSLYYAILGPFVDIYLQPPAGLHIQALVGFAHISPSYDLSKAATGFGSAIGVGYELRTSKRWNVGVLGRIAFSSLSRGRVADRDREPTVIEPALLITATFFPEAK